MIEQIYLSLILIGITIVAVVTVLWYQSRKASRINLALIRLNQQHNFDTPMFLTEAWPLLTQGGLMGMHWHLDWFGIVKENQYGERERSSIHHRIDVAEMKLSITFYHKASRGEHRYFKEALIETFLLLLHTDMLIKANTTDATFSQMSKLNLFLQHDMKNIAQFIQLMADQVAAIPVGKEQQVLNYLRHAAPMIRDRADRIVRTLTGEPFPRAPLRKISLHEVVSGLCELHALDANIEGDAVIHSAETAIDMALDNILKNYHDASLRQNTAKPLMSIAITDHHHHIGILIESNNTESTPALERMFEPFWSSDPAGLGIGLYQAKQMLEVHGGSLQVSQNSGMPLRFHILFPTRA